MMIDKQWFFWKNKNANRGYLPLHKNGFKRSKVADDNQDGFADYAYPSI